MLKISQNEIYLPAIQRKFVWGPDRIEMIFDSIMRGYPIGTFLFWVVKQEAKEQYTFYKFIQNYHERDNAWNEVAPKPDLRDQFLGVLDGQQRLNSMFVALQGSYTYRRKHARWNDDSAFPKRSLYINLFYREDENDDSCIAYKFSFLPATQAQIIDDNNYWFHVRDVLNWPDMTSVYTVMQNASIKYPHYSNLFQSDCAKILTNLWQRLCNDDIINYFSVQEQELDKVVDIFVRVNSAGVQLSKTDLLFSSIVAHWNEGRANIEALIETLNGKGNRFAFNNDFVMRCCLVLSDLPILFKVKSFKQENIEKIKSNWTSIENSLLTTIDLLVEWGFCGETLPTLNAVIPIAYFVFRGGDIGQSKNALRQYLIRALVNQIFARHTDRVLGAIRDRLRIEEGTSKTYTLKDQTFDLKSLLQPEISKDWSLSIADTDIEELLSQTKGAYSFMLLSLLYPNLRFDQIKFHQDHIHPSSKFTMSTLKQLGIVDDVAKNWISLKDQLPNLQLMEGSENSGKNAAFFDVWIQTSGKDNSNFRSSNFIPDNCDLALSNFENFFSKRKEIIREELKAVFTV